MATHVSGHVDLISAIRVAGSALDKFIEGQILFYKLNQKADIISTGITWAIVQPCGLIMVVSVIGHDDKMTVLPFPSHERTPVFWEFVAQAFLDERKALHMTLEMFDVLSHREAPLA